MTKQIIQNSQQRMHKSIEALKQEVAKLRGGRAHPSLIEHVKVVYYGNEVPLNQTANITVGDARTLVVTPWDKSATQAIEKAILNANLGLNPVAAGNVIRVPLPPLTEERRRDMIKVVRAEGESGRVAVRNVRRDANTEIKNLLKDKKITEDEERRAQDEIQKLTDKSIAEIDKILEQKEKELMEV
ncbi:MAG: ribosome recycling factor [Gammaproteobacteria bacterium]|nr:MAG: ribosome recycling factor [Gammaproteobacteria bacterium]